MSCQSRVNFVSNLLVLCCLNLDFLMFVFGFVDFIKMFVIGLCLTMIVNFALELEV